jgi:hypothetical protein
MLRTGSRSTPGPSSSPCAGAAQTSPGTGSPSSPTYCALRASPMMPSCCSGWSLGGAGARPRAQARPPHGCGGGLGRSRGLGGHLTGGQWGDGRRWENREGGGRLGLGRLAGRGDKKLGGSRGIVSHDGETGASGGCWADGPSPVGLLWL